MAAASHTRPGLGRRILALLVWLAARLLLASLRVRVLHPERLERIRGQARPLLYAFWHGRQLALFRVNPAPRLAVMTSWSRDGELQSLICRRFGLEVVRGSSSRGALGGMLAMGRCLRRGTSVGVAVDGPRGPAFDAKPGIAALAGASGAPIVPITIGFRRRIELGRSWDRFQIPAPFTTARLALGEPIEVAPGLERDGLQAVAAELTGRLRALTAEVDAAGAGR